MCNTHRALAARNAPAYCLTYPPARNATAANRVPTRLRTVAVGTTTHCTSNRYGMTAASAKSRAALFQLLQIRSLPIRCELHQDQEPQASGQSARFSASIAFGSQHAHSGTAWFECGPQAEEARGHSSKGGTPRPTDQTG